MFGINAQQNEELDTVIEKVLLSMITYGPEDEEYPKLLETLERLYKLRSGETEKKRVSPDVLFTVLGNILCVLVIVGYEQKHVIGSRAMTFVARLTNKLTS